MLATTFLPHGFALTAPVFEGLAHPDVLQAEVRRNVEHGLLGKTAVHPDQIAHIEACTRWSAKTWKCRPCWRPARPPSSGCTG
jgi:citrate lyase beta subunit